MWKEESMSQEKTIWYICLLVNRAPSLMGKVKKRQFLNFFTFARTTKKITFLFVKNLRKKCTKNCFFHFLELKLFLVEKSDFKSQNKKKSKKNEKKRKFFIKFTKFHNFSLRLIYDFLHFPALIRVLSKS
jgi:hypothetical protein